MGVFWVKITKNDTFGTNPGLSPDLLQGHAQDFTEITPSNLGVKITKYRSGPANQIREKGQIYHLVFTSFDPDLQRLLGKKGEKRKKRKNQVQKVKTTSKSQFFWPFRPRGSKKSENL